MSDNFGFEKIEREQADQDENITSTSVTEDVGAEAPEEDMFRDDFPQKGVNLLDDSMSGGGDMFSSEATPEPLINFGSPASEPTPSPPLKNDIGTDSAPASTKTSACQEEGLMGVPGMPALCCWMKTVDPRDDIARTSLKSDMDDSNSSNCESTSPSFSAESLTGPFHGGGTDIGNLTSDSNKVFDQDSDSSSIVSSSDNEYSSSADESDSESGNEISDVDSPVATETLDQTDKLGAFKPDTQDKQNSNSAGLDYKQLKMEVNKEIVSSDSHGSVEDRVQQDVDAIVENDEIETMEKELPGGAELEPECAANMFDNVPVAGLSETDMLDVIERLTKEDNSTVETCSADSVGNLNENQAIKDNEYERFIRGEEVLSIDNTSPVVSDNDSIENESGSGDSVASDSDNVDSCTDSDLSGDEESLGNWSPSPLYAGNHGSVEEDRVLDDNEAMEVEESGVLAGYEYEEGDSRVIRQDNELNSLRADVKGLMEEMEAIVNENDECTDNSESQTFVDEVLEEMDKSECEKVPEVFKGNEHIVSIMSSGSRERSRTPDNESIHVKFQSPTNILFYDPDCPILERVSAEVADVLIDHDQTYADQQETDLNTTEHGSNQKSENNKQEDLGAAVVKDLKDVYYNLGAKGEIDGASGIVSSSDNKTIDDIASGFSNEVMEEARKETFQSTKDPFDSHDKQELHITDSLYRKRPSGESDIKYVKPTEISQDIMTSESRVKNECDPIDNNPHLGSENTGASLLPQNYVDIESEKEMKSQLLAEKDELGSKDDELTGIVDVDPDAVEMRPKHERIVEPTPAVMYEEDFVVGHDIDVSSRSGSMIIHDEDDSEVQNDVAEAVKVTLAAYRPSRIRALNEELEASVFHDDDVSSCSSSMIIHKVDDTVQSDVSEAVKQTFAAYTSSSIEATEMNALDMKHQKVGLDEVERKRRYSSEFVDVGDHDYLINNQINHDSESEEESVEEQLEAFDSSLNETVIATNSNKCEESIIETFDKENNEETEQKLSISADDQSDFSVGDKNSSREHTTPVKIVSETVKWVLSEVLDLIYWRDVKKTGIVFGTMLFILLSLSCFTILSVAAYLSLAILTVTLSFRVYKNVMQAVQKTNEGHPFKKLLAVDIDLSEDVVQDAAEKIAGNMNNCCKELRRLFLVEDYVDSLKFGLLLWLMTYVGSWFNGMTLVILAVVCIFTLPKVYETYQGPIDQNVNLVRAQLNNIMTQVSSKIPFPKKKAKTQ